MPQAKSAAQLARTALRDLAHDVVRDIIIVGRLGLGAPLGERALAKQLGVSRAPMKDALLRLTREGCFVSRRDCRYTKELGWHEVQRAYQFWQCLECVSVEVSARITEEGEIRLHDQLDRCRTVCQAKDLDSFDILVADIYSTIWWQTDYPYLLNARNRIAAPTFLRMAYCSLYVDDAWAVSLLQHEKALALIRVGKVEGAEAAMAAHVRSACSRTMRVLQGSSVLGEEQFWEFTHAETVGL